MLGAISRNSCCRCSSWFQFSLPAWGAMDLYFHVYINLEISIHAPRMGSDVNQYALVKLHFIFQFTLPGWGTIILLRVIISTWVSFNSRSPHGERWICIFTSTQILKFQFTLPVWGATKLSCMVLISKNFQFSLPVWGATSGFCIFSVTALFFQFTLPV